MNVKNKILVKILIGIVVIVAIVILFQFFNMKKFRINTIDIVKVTIQYKTQEITIKESEKLDEFCDNFSNKEFVLNKSALGHKGWMYRVKFYTTDKLIYDFTIQDENTIIYNGWYYKTEEDIIDLSYMEDIFKGL